MKGGHARSGPAPDPNALRRNRATDAEWRTLPADPGLPVPDWPLPDLLPRESELWSALWRKPQAAVWHDHGQHLEVALYCRRFAEAEAPGAPTNLSTLVRQMGDSLGLTTPGLRTNRWRIAAAPSEAPARLAPVIDLDSILSATPNADS